MPWLETLDVGDCNSGQPSDTACTPCRHGSNRVFLTWRVARCAQPLPPRSTLGAHHAEGLQNGVCVLR
jgi:hypothetical protein